MVPFSTGLSSDAGTDQETKTPAYFTAARVRVGERSDTNGPSLTGLSVRASTSGSALVCAAAATEAENALVLTRHWVWPRT